MVGLAKYCSYIYIILIIKNKGYGKSRKVNCYSKMGRD